MQEIYNLIAKVADTDQHDPHPGRERHGQGTGGARAPFQFHAPASALRRDQLLGAAGKPARESELFGHKKGSFTGAVQDKIGLFEEAEKGTIFLDEVNSMAHPLQTKLLRVLQERQIRRVGDTKSMPINVRVLAATNEALQRQDQRRQFPRRSLLPARRHPDRDARAARAAR